LNITSHTFNELNQSINSNTNVLHYINCGSSDAILIEASGHYGLIDSSNPYQFIEHEVEHVQIDESIGERNQWLSDPDKSVQAVIDYLLTCPAIINSPLYFNFINAKNDNAKIKRLNHMEIQKLNLKTVTEEEYFDPSSTNSLHLGRIMDINEIKKAYKHKIKFWMAKENSGFPVSAYDVKPIFEFALMFILDQIKTDEKTNQYDKHAYEYISKTLLNMVQEKHSFPVKTSVPIYPSIAFQATFLNASKDEKYLPDDLFEIPEDYKVGNVFFEHIHK